MGRLRLFGELIEAGGAVEGGGGGGGGGHQIARVVRTSGDYSTTSQSFVDIDATGSSGLTTLKVQILNWNAAAGKYFRGAAREFSGAELAANTLPALEAEVRGATVFLKVVSATATSLLLNVYATPS